MANIIIPSQERPRKIENPLANILVSPFELPTGEDALSLLNRDIRGRIREQVKKYSPKNEQGINEEIKRLYLQSRKSESDELRGIAYQSPLEIGGYFKRL